MTAEEFFISQSAQYARSLPVMQSVQFLRGLLLLVGDKAEVDAIRRVYVNLCEEDSRLELIASGQLLLPLDGQASGC